MIKMSLSKFKLLVKNVQCLKCEIVTLSEFKIRFSRLCYKQKKVFLIYPYRLSSQLKKNTSSGIERNVCYTIDSSLEYCPNNVWRTFH